jgi:hypothetical protein
MTQSIPSRSDATPQVASDSTSQSIAPDIRDANVLAGNTARAQPHELECLIQRTLEAQPGLKFSRLKVHQYPQGICLEGLLETNEDGLDLCDLVSEISGVEVINHVVTRQLRPR